LFWEKKWKSCNGQVKIIGLKTNSDYFLFFICWFDVYLFLF